MTDLMDLSAGFDPGAEADWRVLVDKSLAGKPFDTLIRRTPEGLAVRPVYRETDAPVRADPLGAPGLAPFARGRTPVPDLFLPWDIRQVFAHPDPLTTNREILTDLERGVSSIELAVDPQGVRGVAIRKAGDLTDALAGVLLDLAPVALAADDDGIAAAALLSAHLTLAGVGAQAPASFNVDPLGALLRTGALAPDALSEALAFAAFAAEAHPAALALRADARAVHEAGGGEAQELGVLIAAGVALLKEGERQGLAATDVSRLTLFTLSVGPDTMAEIAKLRAARLLWARVMEACGAPCAARSMRLQAVTSGRMMTRRDPWTNMLRTTAAAFAAGAGGADVVSVRAFTDALGLPTPFARRIARNTHIVLQEEAHIGKVADPAGGAWYVETMTRDLAEAAWAVMQTIERRGGLVQAFADGSLAGDIARVRDARARAVATRREPVTGVSDFPDLGEAIAETAAADPAAVLARRAPAALDQRPASRAFADLAGAAAMGVGIARLATPGARVAPGLAAIRLAAPFEDLRDRADAAGAPPEVFCVTLGALAEFNARAGFARNLLAAGGVRALSPESEYATLAAMTEAFSASRARVAILCGSDARYGAQAGEAAAALKQAGAAWVILAGKPGALEATLREAGVDQFVFAGDDAPRALATIHAALGLG
jgi:methylmalonyl-CoA mutase